MSSGADVGVIGMAVMGSNLARNLARNGYRVAIYNRTAARTRQVMAEHGSEGQFLPSEDLAEFVASLEPPRVAIVMVVAGKPTDAVIDQLVPLLSPGDIVVDAGNAHFLDTRRREHRLVEQGLHFVGMGVSGGEEGALWGPAIMPGGSVAAYQRLEPMLTAIAAHVNGEPCCSHVGPDGAGHFVKMVHNGIEYADMQLIAEAYDLLRAALGRTPSELAEVFARWNETELNSYLIEITATVLAKQDARTGKALVDVILDQAGQKGTGRWTVQSALDLGAPVTGIAEATFARAISAALDQRAAVHGLFEAPSLPQVQAESFIEDIRLALLASKIVAYAQGFDEIAAASAQYGWDVDRAALAAMWRGGCIIRAGFLDTIRAAFEANPASASLIAEPAFTAMVRAALPSWRRVVAWAAQAGIPAPVFSSSLAYLDALGADRLPASLIQGQRDYFGAHTYRRVDVPGVFHTLWSGDGTEVEA